MAHSVTRAMLIEHLSLEFSISKEDATKVFDCLLEKVRSELVNGRSVSIKNFGTFKTKVHKGHMVQDVEERIGDMNGSMKPIKDYNVVKFRPARGLKEAVNGGISPGGTKRTVGGLTDGVARKRPGRPKKELTKLEKIRREVALQMIRENMEQGKVISNADISRSTHISVHQISRWRNEAGLSIAAVREQAELNRGGIRIYDNKVKTKGLIKDEVPETLKPKKRKSRKNAS